MHGHFVSDIPSQAERFQIFYLLRDVLLNQS